MRAGALRHKIMIQAKSTAAGRDSFGGQVVAWTSNRGVWAEVKPIRGSQYFEAQQVQSAVTHKIRIRYTTLAGSTEITPGNCRAKWGTRIFNIHAALNPDERNIMLDLMCSEEV